MKNIKKKLDSLIDFFGEYMLPFSLIFAFFGGIFLFIFEVRFIVKTLW